MPHRILVSVALLVALGWSSPARAVDFFWTGPLIIGGGPDGDFRNSQNWTFTPPPFPLVPAPGGANDAVNFDLGRAPDNRYSVTNVHGENNRLIVHDDSLTLVVPDVNIGAATDYVLSNDTTTSPSLTIGVALGDVADVILAGGGGRAVIDMQTAAIGRSAFSTGILTVTDELRLLGSGDLMVGESGTGTLTIQNGAVVASDSGLLGLNEGLGFFGSGTVVVTGADSTWSNSEDLTVGFDGEGELSIIAGGSVSNERGIIGVNEGSIGQVTVIGEGSTWTNNSELRVGESGQGTLTISNGGSVSSEPESGFTTAGLVGWQDGSTGMVTVSGADSTWDNNGGLGVGVFGSGTLTIQNGAAVTTGGSAGLGARTDSTGAATVTGAGSTWAVSGNLNVGGDFGSTGGDGTLSIQAGGAVTSGAGFIANNDGSIGTVTVDGAGSSWTIDVDLTVGNEGTATLGVQNGGTVTVGSAGGGDLTGTTGSQLTLDSGGVLDVRGTIDMNEGTFNFLGGTLHVETFEGNLTNPAGGMLAPGTIGPSAGSTTTTGDYTQQAGATLDIEIGGIVPSTFDRLLVEGNVMLGGTLGVSLIDNFEPLIGNTFTILETNFGVVAGQFNNEILPIFGGLTLDVIYSTNSVMLEVVAAPLAGDYNDDGTVNAADYVVWRENEGTNNTLSNDPIGGMIGQAHYDQWRANFGATSSGSGSGSGSALGPPSRNAVPEPTGWILVLAACAALPLLRSHLHYTAMAIRQIGLVL